MSSLPWLAEHILLGYLLTSSPSLPCLRSRVGLRDVWQQSKCARASCFPARGRGRCSRQLLCRRFHALHSYSIIEHHHCTHIRAGQNTFRAMTRKVGSARGTPGSMGERRTRQTCVRTFCTQKNDSISRPHRALIKSVAEGRSVNHA